MNLPQMYIFGRIGRFSEDSDLVHNIPPIWRATECNSVTLSDLRPGSGDSPLYRINVTGIYMCLRFTLYFDIKINHFMTWIIKYTSTMDPIWVNYSNSLARIKVILGAGFITSQYLKVRSSISSVYFAKLFPDSSYQYS